MVMPAKKSLSLSLSISISSLLLFCNVASAQTTRLECSTYAAGSEHRRTCDAYDDDKDGVVDAVIVPAGSDLNAAVSAAKAGQLLVLGSTNRSAPYRLSSPLILKDEVSLLADESGVNGFFDLGWANNFAIGADDPVYCLVFLGKNSQVTGIRVNTSTMSAGQELYFNQLNVPKAVIYTTGSPGFSVSWGSFVGRPGLDAVLWAKNADERNNVQGGTTHRVTRNWIQMDGAGHGVRIESAETGKSDRQENIQLKHNVVLLDKMPEEAERQEGVHIKNGVGEVEHNDFVYRDDSLFEGQQRVGLTVEDIAGGTLVENAMVSEQSYRLRDGTLFREEDFAYRFLESTGKTLRVRTHSESVSRRMALSTGNASGKGIDINEVYLMDSLPYFDTETQFFSRGAPRPRRGSCFTPLYLTENLTRTAEEVRIMNVAQNRSAEDGWYYTCGGGTSREDFNFPMAFENNAGESHSSSAATIAAVIGWGVAIVSTVTALAMGGYIWKLKKRVGALPAVGTAGGAPTDTNTVISNAGESIKDALTPADSGFSHHRLDETLFSRDTSPVPDPVPVPALQGVSTVSDYTPVN